MTRALLLATAAVLASGTAALAQGTPVVVANTVTQLDYTSAGGSLVINQVGGGNLLGANSSDGSGKAVFDGGSAALNVTVTQVNAAADPVATDNRIGARVRTRAGSAVTLRQGTLGAGSTSTRPTAGTAVANSAIQADVGYLANGTATSNDILVALTVTQAGGDGNTASVAIGRQAAMNNAGNTVTVAQTGAGNIASMTVDRLSGRTASLSQTGNDNTTTLNVGQDVAVGGNVTVALNGDNNNTIGTINVDGTSGAVSLTVNGRNNLMDLDINGGQADLTMAGENKTLTIVSSGTIQGASTSGGWAVAGTGTATFGNSLDTAFTDYSLTIGGTLNLTDTAAAGGVIGTHRAVTLTNLSGQTISVANSGALGGTLGADSNTGLAAQANTGLRIVQGGTGAHLASLYNTAAGSAFNVEQSGSSGQIARIANTAAGVWYVLQNSAVGSTLEGQNSVAGATLSVYQTGTAAQAAYFNNTGASSVTIYQNTASGTVGNVIGSSANPVTFNGSPASVVISQTN